MVNPFICGCGSFHHQAEDDDDESCNPCATPRKQKKSSNRIFRSKDNKNPYSTCGRDKFSALLAKLEDKRQEIYTQIGPEVCYVRFVYTNSKKFKPVVVKVRDKEQKKYIFDDDKSKSMKDNSVASGRFPIESGDETTKKKMEMWRPYYLAEVIIFILLVLAVFRLTIAILCTSLVWYLVSGISNAERRRKKQDLLCKKGE